MDNDNVAIVIKLMGSTICAQLWISVQWKNKHHNTQVKYILNYLRSVHEIQANYCVPDVLTHYCTYALRSLYGDVEQSCLINIFDINCIDDNYNCILVPVPFPLSSVHK